MEARITLTIRIDPELAKKLARRARSDDATINQTVVTAIKLYIEEANATNDTH